MKKIELLILSAASLTIKMIRILFWILTWATFPVWFPFWKITNLIYFSREEREFLVGYLNFSAVRSYFIYSTKNVFSFKTHLYKKALLCLFKVKKKPR